MESLNNLFLYIPGIIIFIVGTANLKNKNYTIDDLIHPFIMILIGALLILLAFYEGNNNKVMAMANLSIIVLLFGFSLLLTYFKRKKLQLETVVGKVIDVDKRLLSKKGKFKLGEKYTFYPIVECKVNNQIIKRKCKINSSFEKAFKIGDTFDLYYSKITDNIYEKKDTVFLLVLGIILSSLGIILCITTIYGSSLSI